MSKIKLPKQQLSVEMLAESANEEHRTIDVMFYSGAEVKRMSWFDGAYFLSFSMKPEHVRMGRLNNGAPVLNAHSDWSLSDVLGVVEKGWLEDGKGKATLRFSDRPDVQPIWADIKNKIIRNVSMGAAIHKLKDLTKEDEKVKRYLAVDWEPLEISAVPIGADPGAGFLAENSKQELFEVEVENLRADAHHEEKTMEETQEVVVGSEAANKPDDTEKLKQAVEQERVRVEHIRTALKLAKLDGDQTLCDEVLSAAKPLTVKQAGERILGRVHELSSENETRSHNLAVTQDSQVVKFAGMENMLHHRMDPVKTKLEVGREFFGFSVLDLAKECLAAHGISSRGLSKMQILDVALRPTVDQRLMMTTSDFPSLLANVGVKRLRQAYDENSPSYRVWARRAPNAPDFKTMTVVQLGSNPDLLQVNDGGEFKYGSLTDGKETYSMITYGRLLSFSRQAMINDDLRGFDRALQGFGNAAARLENRTVYAILTANAALINDGITLFHASSHGANLIAAGTVISDVNLGIARKTMRLQKGLQTEELNIVPRYLIVPAAKEQVAYQWTSANYVPATAATTNEFRTGGKTALEVVVESILDANSATAWYLAADPAQIDTVEYCYLDGNEGVFTETRTGFEIDGMDIKARLDFAAKAIDYRGLFKNVGA
jgi:hypothetical protein